MIEIPARFAASQRGFGGQAFLDALPERIETFLARWRLSVDGPAMHGVAALVLPVRRADGAPAVLKLQAVDGETEGEPAALRAWGGDGAVRLLDHDAATGTMLLERLSPRDLNGVQDVVAGTRVVGELLVRLNAVPAPSGMRSLGGIAARMLEGVPRAVRALADERERRLVEDCAAAVREVAGEPGDRLLHWDLHFENVLTRGDGPGAAWVAIDPKPLRGDPGYELMPALRNRIGEGRLRERFDVLVDVLGLDRERARAWTLGRVLESSLWAVAAGDRLPGECVEIGAVLRGR
ncbi:aminoglycoside phosphotransferase family protein [Streptomyces sp. NPDC060194]|uniref:aminoglycoside phosphotransferase family protein n=1 Tax=Streptomyces sp. NPDC060194 TaxID=3347069 RepID=UPI003665FC04